MAAAGSFAQAARQLGLTRAAVSRRVAVIEAQIGHSLFQRSTRAFKLTEAGRRLALRGREVHEAAQAARQGLRRAGEAAQADGSLHGSLRITSVPNLGQSVLAPLLARFAAQHPRLRLDLRFTHRRLDLLRDDIDLALRVTERPPEDCVATPLLRFAVRAYAAPGAGLPLAAPADLAYHPCLVLGLPSDGVAALWRQDQQPRREAEVRLEPAVQGDDLACLIALAQHGGGIVFAPDYCVQRELAEGRLIEALPGWRMALYEGQTVMALTPPVAQASAAARALVQFLKANLSPS